MSIKQWIQRNNLLADLAAHLRTPLYRNGYALMVSTAATSGLGAIYWVIAARAYQPELVGQYSAAVAAMLFLAGAAGLFLDGAMVRFIPRAGTATQRLIGLSYLISALAAVLAAGLFLLGIKLWAPALAFLTGDPWLFSGFIAGTVIIVIFSEQDGALTGLRQATWVPLENSIYAVLKIAMLIALAWLIPQYGILASWIIPAIPLIAAVNLLIFSRLAPAHVQKTLGSSEPLVVRQISRYTAANYFSYLFANAGLLIPPIMVLQIAGARASAYFYLPWIIASSLRLFATNMSNSLVVEGAINQEKTLDYFNKALVNMVRLLLPIVAILFFFTPLILSIFGKEYSSQGLALLRWLLLGAFPGAMVSLFSGLLRVKNQVGRIVIIQAGMTFLLLLQIYFLLPRYGITAVGWAWLATHSVTALVILATQQNLIKPRRNAKVPPSDSHPSSQRPAPRPDGKSVFYNVVTSLRSTAYFGAHKLLLGSSIGPAYRNLYRDDQSGETRKRTRQLLLKILRHAQRSVPYYNAVVPRTGHCFGEEPLTFLSSFPILTKDIIRQNFDRLKSNDLSRRRWTYNSSGGSTGEPIDLIQDRYFTDYQMAIQFLSYNWAGRQLGEAGVHVWGSWRDILNHKSNVSKRILDRLTNDRFFNAFMMTPEKMRTYLDQLNQNPPRLVIAYAISIYELVQFAEREGISIRPQAAIMTSAGTLHPFMREKIETAFRCKVFNRYGSREVGDIACECEAHAGLHVFPSGNYVEIVDDQGHAVPNGEEGNILVTNLYNYAMPLIRYYIGDRGVLSRSDRCACGRQGQILEKISGRNVEMFRKRDGTLVDGLFFNHFLYYKEWVQKFQVVQKDYERVVFKIQKTTADYEEWELEEIRQKTRVVMGGDCEVTFEFVDDIPPSRSGKYSYTISEIPQGIPGINV
jgi:phenylacetate-CoA ligase